MVREIPTTEPHFNRRIFIATAVLSAAALACNPPRRDIGSPRGAVDEEWSSERILEFAETMLGETEYPQIARAGQVLVNNQLGVPSLSEVSPLFAERRLRIYTSRALSSGQDIPMLRAPLSKVEPVPSFPLKGKPGTPDTSVSGNSKIALEEVAFAEDFLREFSPFYQRFALATMLIKPAGIEMAGNYAMRGLYRNYQIPTEQSQKNALAIDALGTYFEEMPVIRMADLWGNFVMIPDFQKARDKKRFSRKDQEMFGLLETPSEIFSREKVMLKNSAGDYEWTQDSDLFYKTWYRAALSGYRALPTSMR